VISDLIKKVSQQALSRSDFHYPSVLEKPIVLSNIFILIGNSDIHTIPGHVHLSVITDIPKEASRERSAIPFEFDTLCINDKFTIDLTNRTSRVSVPTKTLKITKQTLNITRHLFQKPKLTA